ncbi:prenyltransferase [candidate division KSB1 bacterium]|nr:prenyltransferase [candidate division KSB1 bacterium]
MTKNNKPSLVAILRAPFFSSILAPLLIGTLIAVVVNGSINWLGFVLILVMGLGLHAATNVYNDIYDTLQGTDRINIHRNDFSGGSGLLLQHPALLTRMYHIARISLLVAILAMAGLFFVVEKRYWLLLAGLNFLSAFFSKYYTAAPIKLASRGLGEISVWFAFGPMAVLAGAISQNVTFHPYVLAAMPMTGLSTTSILWMGQLIDLPADAASGKRGLVARLGTRFARYFFAFIHLLIVIDIILLALFVIPKAWILLLGLLPYPLFFPQAWKIVHRYHDQPPQLQKAAGLNVQIHMLFSVSMVVALLLYILIY